MIPENFIFDAAELYEQMAKQMTFALRKWAGSRRRGVIDAIGAGLPSAPSKHHWVQHVSHDRFAIGARLVPTVARYGNYAIHVRGSKPHHFYVVDHIPSGAEVQVRRLLANAKEVARTLHEQFPDIGGGPIGTMPDGESVSRITPTIARLLDKHGSRG